MQNSGRQDRVRAGMVNEGEQVGGRDRGGGEEITWALVSFPIEEESNRVACVSMQVRPRVCRRLIMAPASGSRWACAQSAGLSAALSGPLFRS